MVLKARVGNNVVIERYSSIHIEYENLRKFKSNRSIEEIPVTMTCMYGSEKKEKQNKDRYFCFGAQSYDDYINDDDVNDHDDDDDDEYYFYYNYS